MRLPESGRSRLKRAHEMTIEHTPTNNNKSASTSPGHRNIACYNYWLAVTLAVQSVLDDFEALAQAAAAVPVLHVSDM